MANWIRYFMDVKMTFPNGTFSNGEKIFMEIPGRFQKWYPLYVVLQI